MRTSLPAFCGRSIKLLAALVVTVALGVLAGVGPTLINTQTAYAAPTRAGIAEIANGQVGTKGTPNRCQPYGPMCADWCAMFATWAWQKAGVAGAPRGTYVATAIGVWGQKQGLFKARPDGQRGNPLPGDVVVYGQPGSGTGGHVSVVYSVNGDGTITTIDGNYGNQVKRRVINPITARAGGRDVLISGYVSPPGVTDGPTNPTGTVGDFSGDGFSDLLGVDDKGQLFFYPNLSMSSGKFQPTVGPRAAVGNGGWKAFPHVMSADFSGDRHADVLAIDDKGQLFFYPNVSRTSGKFVPTLGARVAVGNGGWGSFKFVQAADFSGDGFADLIAVDDKGQLFFYPNLSMSSGKFVPAVGPRVPVGTGGWGSFKFVQAADFSGDKFADLLAVDDKGQLFFYPNVSMSTGKFVPTIGARTAIGNGGWGSFTFLQVADFSGDWHADLQAVDDKGQLFYYPNLSKSTGKFIPALGAQIPVGNGGWGSFQTIA